MNSMMITTTGLNDQLLQNKNNQAYSKSSAAENRLSVKISFYEEASPFKWAFQKTVYFC